MVESIHNSNQMPQIPDSSGDPSGLQQQVSTLKDEVDTILSNVQVSLPNISPNILSMIQTKIQTQISTLEAQLPPSNVAAQQAFKSLDSSYSNLSALLKKEPPPDDFSQTVLSDLTSMYTSLTNIGAAL